jgi:hypothetical protein
MPAYDIYFCTISNAARTHIRGHSDQEGNFIQLLNLYASDNQHFQQWLQQKVDYTSPSAQNKMPTMTSHAIVREIASDVIGNGPFAVIVDRTQVVKSNLQYAFVT